MELLCELSEFAYETKCFKYWKNEKASNPEITIPEFADCLMITLCFCDLSNVDKLELKTIEENDMVKLFIEANKLAASLTINISKNDILKILSILLKISNLLGYSKEELEKYCNDKMNKTLEMIKNDK